MHYEKNVSAPAISVIMPVYNVEKFVGKAIESMLSQTFGDFEFIIVDDGTPDRSGEICDEYAKRDSRIHVIHKENGGAPKARNAAIDIARGKYMYFMDSDDWAEPSMLEDMYKLAEKHSAQLVISGYYIDTYYTDFQADSEGGKYTQIQTADDAVYKDQYDFRTHAYELFDKNLLYSPWNKLFLSEYILKNGLRFPTTWMDDFPFNLSVIRDIENVVFTSKAYYHFLRARSESETAKYKSNMYEKREEEHTWMLELYKYWSICDAASSEMIQRRYIERIIGCIENVTNKNCTLTRRERKAEIKRIINNPRVSEALSIAKPRSSYMKLMLLPLKWKSTGLCYAEGVFVSHIKSGNVKLFARLKANR